MKLTCHHGYFMQMVDALMAESKELTVAFINPNFSLYKAEDNNSNFK